MSASCPALVTGAPASGQGKTSVTAALARWHRRQGRDVRVFKTGPDFLDPLLLERASGKPCYQLDLWFAGEADVRARLHAAAREADLILIEGVMGLYDGKPSGADLAVLLGVPVLAIIDSWAMARTFGAVAHGLATYREDLRLYGVAANRVGSEYHGKLLRDSLPDGMAWLGSLPRDPDLALPERHGGLLAPEEISELDAKLDALADAWAAGAEVALPPAVAFPEAEMAPVPRALAGTRIAIARDRAFCFLYPANLDVLRAAGAELVFFSPLADAALPDCDAVWLPGGYPELHLAELGCCRALHRALAAHVEAGKPLLAECGGLLFLLDELTDYAGHTGHLAGLLPGRGRMEKRLGGFGSQGATLPQGALRGHTFHYAHVQVDAEPVARSQNPKAGPSDEPVYQHRRMTAAMLHWYFPSNPEAAVRLFAP